AATEGTVEGGLAGIGPADQGDQGLAPDGGDADLPATQAGIDRGEVGAHRGQGHGGDAVLLDEVEAGLQPGAQGQQAVADRTEVAGQATAQAVDRRTGALGV